MIYRDGPGDVGITVNYARDVEVSHNTVILNGTFPWGAIEYRFGPTAATIAMTMIEISSTIPTAVMTESSENTMSRSRI